MKKRSAKKQTAKTVTARVHGAVPHMGYDRALWKVRYPDSRWTITKTGEAWLRET